MRVPVSQLKRFVAFPCTVEELAEIMNARISEVEGIHRFPTREAFQGVRLVELIEVVEAGEEFSRWSARSADGEHHLVVGNRYAVGPGQRFAAVLAGSPLPDGGVAQARPVAGLMSDGLLLSEASAGIGADATNPLAVAPEVALDADPFEVFELDDVVLDFDLEPNRSDLYSLAGMARDVSAIFDRPLTLPPVLEPDWTPLPDEALRVELRTPNCHRYAGLEVDGLRVGPSPQWLQNAVRKLGMRPINNVVDAANLAMMELGQPMHTFDRRTLKTGVIGLRMARAGETLTTLDGVERTLTEECMLVVDGDEPVALAGVMGDQHSEIRADTERILIESAAFDMFTVRRCSRRLALRTESSLRFEKGLPQTAPLLGMQRLAWLLVELCGATIGRFVDAWPAPPDPRVILFDTEEARARMGMQVPDALIRRRFAALGFEVDDDWNVTVPTNRPDVTIQEDLNEEVGRIHGYENVESVPAMAPLTAPRRNPVFTRGFVAREVLVGAGFDEVSLQAWIGEDEVEAYGIDRAALAELKNPLSAQWRYFRPSTLPDLVSAVRLNRNNRHEGFRLFEVAKVYGRLPATGALMERHHLSGALDGEAFYEARDAVLAVLEALGLEGSIGRDTPNWALAHAFHPGRYASIAVDDKTVAVVGELHPRLLRSLDLDGAITTFHVDLEALLGMEGRRATFRAPPRFPSMEFHLNVLAPARHLAGELLRTVGEARLEGLVRHGIRDVYTGQGVASGMKRITLELEFNHPERSLVQDEVLAQMQRLRSALSSAGMQPEG